MTKVLWVPAEDKNHWKLGSGVDAKTWTMLGESVEYDNEPTDNSQRYFANARVVNTRESLNETLGMNAQLGVRYALSSASAGMNLQSSTAFNTQSTFVLARGNCVMQPQGGRNYRLRQLLLPRLADPKAFAEDFGDMFVRRVVKGGDFFCLIRITHTDKTLENRLAVSLSVDINAGIGGAKFEGEFNEARKVAGSRSEYEVYYFQTGGAGSGEVSATRTVDEVRERLRTFPDAVLRNGWQYMAELASYGTLALPIPAPDPLSEALQKSIENTAKLNDRLIGIRNDIGFALEHPEFFRNLPPMDELRDAQSRYTEAANAVLRHLQKLARKDIGPEHFNDAALGLPSVKLEKITAGNARTLVDFYLARNDPGMLPEDQQFVAKLEEVVRHRVANFDGVQDPGGDQAKTELLRAELLRRELEREKISEFRISGLRLRSIGSLGLILPQSVSSVTLEDCSLESLQGIEQLIHLESLAITGSKLESDDIAHLGVLGLLQSLDLSSNSVGDISPLATLTSLVSLNLAGNWVMDLSPLAKLTDLASLGLGRVEFRADNDVSSVHLSANIARLFGSMAKHPVLGNPFFGAKKMIVRYGGDVPNPGVDFIGTASFVDGKYRVVLTDGRSRKEEEWVVLNVARIPPEAARFMPGFALTDAVSVDLLRQPMNKLASIWFRPSIEGRSLREEDGAPRLGPSHHIESVEY